MLSSRHGSRFTVHVLSWFTVYGSRFMNVAIIVAAGRGSRAGGVRAKQFREISGIPIIIHTLSRFEQCETIGRRSSSCPPTRARSFCRWPRRTDSTRSRARSPGGETRAESVWRGLEAAVDGVGVGVVAVHDGVRPFVTPEEIDRTVREAEEPAPPSSPRPRSRRSKRSRRAESSARYERARLWHAQTPQCFRYELLRRAYEQPGARRPTSTD